MAKAFKKPPNPDLINAILTVVGVIISLIIVVGTASAIFTYISSTWAARWGDFDDCEPSVTYRELDEFADDDERLDYAASLLDQRLYQAAEAFLSKFLETAEPNSRLFVAIRYNRGLAYLYLKEYDQAISDFSAVTGQADYSDAYYNLGNAFAGQHDYEKALEAYDAALELEQKPEYSEVRDAVLALLD